MRISYTRKIHMIHSWPQELESAERVVSLKQSTSPFVSSIPTDKRYFTSFTQNCDHTLRHKELFLFASGAQGQFSVFFLGVSLSTTWRLCAPLGCCGGRTIGRRFNFRFLFTQWKLLLLPAKQHPSQGVLKGRKSHSSILCHHHGHLYGHEEDGVKEHEIMLWYGQMPGVLEREHNWPQQGYLAREGHLQPFITFWFPVSF